MKKVSFRGRLITVFMIFSIAFIAIIVNIIRIQLFQHKEWSETAYKQYYRGKEIRGERGKILTKNRVKIAYDTQKYEIVLDPTKITDNLDKMIEVLDKYLEINKSKLKKDILYKQKIKSKYLQVGKSILKMDRDEISKKMTREEKKGLYFVKKIERVYPKWDQFNHITGFLNIENNGVYGIEKEFNKYLKEDVGFQKKYIATHIAFNLPVGKKGEFVPPENGKNIILTIDYVMQHILKEEVTKIFEESKSDWSAGIILDPSTGKILAMTSLPINEKKVRIRNNAIYNQYEPGSVFKPLIIAAALNEGLINQNSVFHSDGKIKVYNKIIREHDSKTKGDFSIEDTLVHSSNVAMVRIGEKFDRNTYYNYLKEYGFGEYTGIELSGERKVSLPHYSKWSGLSIPTISFGQGIALTPLQMAISFAAVINGGILYKPQIVDSIENDSGEVLKKYVPVFKRRIITDEISKKMREYLYAVVEKGTGKNAKIVGYKIGGKTGTSQMSEKGKGYNSGKHVSSFIGFFPVEDPKYLMLVLYSNPKGRKFYGSQLAAPAFKETMKRILKYKNIYPTNIASNIIDLSNIKKEEVEDNEFLKEITDKLYLPDMTGKTLRSALNLLNGAEIDLDIKGNGIIKKQSPRPGVLIKKVKKIYLTLEE